jgi:hypothetical protein
MAGSLGLNKRFEEAVRNVVGEYVFADLRKTKGYGLALRTFDREVKRAFQGDPDEEYFVNFPLASLEDDPESNLEANCWRMTGCVPAHDRRDFRDFRALTLSREDVQKIFAPSSKISFALSMTKSSR